MFIGILFITDIRPAQRYQTGIGYRVSGLVSGLIVKNFVSTASALERIPALERKRADSTEFQEKTIQPAHPHVYQSYYGSGRYMFFFQNERTYYYNDHRLYTSSPAGGIDGILHMQYTFKDVPANTALDFKPFIDFFNGSTVYFDGGLNLNRAG